MEQHLLFEESFRRESFKKANFLMGWRVRSDKTDKCRLSEVYTALAKRNVD